MYESVNLIKKLKEYIRIPRLPSFGGQNDQVHTRVLLRGISYLPITRYKSGPSRPTPPILQIGPLQPHTSGAIRLSSHPSARRSRVVIRKIYRTIKKSWNSSNCNTGFTTTHLNLIVNPLQKSNLLIDDEKWKRNGKELADIVEKINTESKQYIYLTTS